MFCTKSMADIVPLMKVMSTYVFNQLEDGPGCLALKPNVARRSWYVPLKTSPRHTRAMPSDPCKKVLTSTPCSRSSKDNSCNAALGSNEMPFRPSMPKSTGQKATITSGFACAIPAVAKGVSQLAQSPAARAVPSALRAGKDDHPLATVNLPRESTSCTFSPDFHQTPHCRASLDVPARSVLSTNVGLHRTTGIQSPIPDKVANTASGVSSFVCCARKSTIPLNEALTPRHQLDTLSLSQLDSCTSLLLLLLKEALAEDAIVWPSLPPVQSLLCS
mmetsp:Transcript_21544/g.39528  ORF Transcript_21544/g.39528 Transcript_21544/m.39528 type:complete len:275 (+) Transcript_21544:468-1292(+)